MHSKPIAKARDIDALFYALMDDVIQASNMWHERGDDFSRRLYVRTVFALVEGATQVMKSAALIFDEVRNPSLLTPKEVILLKEEEMPVGQNGSGKPRKIKISFLDNFEFALKTYARVAGKTLVLEKDKQGWQSLNTAVNIRNQLTHPHTVKDLQLSVEDMKTVEQAMKFFRDTTGQLLHK